MHLQAVYSILPYYLGNFMNEIKENPAVSAYFEEITSSNGWPEIKIWSTKQCKSNAILYLAR